MSAGHPLSRRMAREARLQAARAIAGTDGGAAAARPIGKPYASLEIGPGATRMADENPLDTMNLSRLQQDVAMVLLTTWQDALPAIVLPGSYGTGAGHGGQRHLTADQELAAARAYWDYGKAMDHLTHNAGAARASAVRAAVIMGERAHVAAVKDGLDCLARYWRMR